MSPKIKSQIDQITKQIVSKYNPLKIILFGSTVSGKRSKESDFDFFIIKKTAYDPIKRIQLLSSLIERTTPCDFFVFTPDEVKKRHQLGDFFIKDIFKSGKTLYEKQ